MGATKLLTAGGGGVTLDAASTATDKTITIPADNGTLVYANSSGNVGIGTSSSSYTASNRVVVAVKGGAAGGLIDLQSAGGVKDTYGPMMQAALKQLLVGLQRQFGLLQTVQNAPVSTPAVMS